MKKIKRDVLFSIFFSLVSCSNKEAMDFYNKNIDNLSYVSPDKIITNDNKIFLVKSNNFPVYKVFVEICKNHKVIKKETTRLQMIYGYQGFYSISLDNGTKYIITESLDSKYDDLKIGFKCPVYINE